MAKQGKCNQCEVRYEWDRECPLRLTACPECNRTLQKTNYLLKSCSTVRLKVTPMRGKQPTRLLKTYCPKCGYTLRVTLKWLTIAVPTCPHPGCGRESRKMKVVYPPKENKR